MVSLRRVPLSGDELVDWVFKQFIFFLSRKTLHIKRKKRLLDPDDKSHRSIMGMMDSGAAPKIKITINCAKSLHKNRDKEVETLIHELGHIVFWKTPERFIKQIEEILIDRFTQEQKNFLKSFIPRHEVKK